MRAALPLVCVPGLGLDPAAWAPTLASLPETDARVVVLPGYGLRPSRSDDLRPDLLAARLVDRLVDLPSPVVLAGHSASCQLVVGAAASAPQLVSGLVLIGPTTDPRAASWPGLAHRWLRTACWERPGQIPYLARTYRRTGLGSMARTMAAARRDDVRQGIGAVRCPVLVVRGRHDRICPDDWARALASIAPAGSRALALARGAHMVPLTHGDLVAAAVGRLAGA